MIQKKLAGPLNEESNVGIQPIIVGSLAVNASVNRACGNTRLLRECMEDGE